MSVSHLKLHLSLKGRSIRDYTFVRETVSIGRDPQADIFLDNAGVSRDQARLLRTPDGWVIEDSQSSNGTWLNGREVVRERLSDQDEVTIGKFSLRVSLVEDRLVLPPPGGPARLPAAAQIDGTTVMTRGQLAEVLEFARDGRTARMNEFQDEAAPASTAQAGTLRRRIALVAALLLAMAVGAGLVVLLMR
jgi:pSer/pThr/pTyr-binding forkhead associated (FHA) protein